MRFGFKLETLEKFSLSQTKVLGHLRMYFYMVHLVQKKKSLISDIINLKEKKGGGRRRNTIWVHFPPPLLQVKHAETF